MGSLRPHLRSDGGVLTIGGVKADLLARRYGTPSYVTDLDRVKSLYSEAAGCLSAEHSKTLIAFATKANATPAVVRALAKEGAGVTVVSLAGLRLAKACGVSPRDVIFDGPSKSPSELEGAVTAGVGMINAESTQEVTDLERVCARVGRGCRVGFRVNLGIRADTHAGLATGGSEHKFGVPVRDVLKFCRGEGKKLRKAKLVGVHSHIGSQITDPDVFGEMSSGLSSLTEEMETATGTPVEEVNFGGGAGVAYEPGKEQLSFKDYAASTARAFTRSRGSAAKKMRFVFELGRSLVADSTVLLTRVNYVKSTGSKDWALVDAGMNDFLRPALYGAHHEVVPVKGRKGGPRTVYDVGGPVCESTDVFAEGRSLDGKLKQGDLLAILDTGAYGISMASWYNMRPIPPVIAVAGGKYRLASPKVEYPA